MTDLKALNFSTSGIRILFSSSPVKLCLTIFSRLRKKECRSLKASTWALLLFRLIYAPSAPMPCRNMSLALLLLNLFSRFLTSSPRLIRSASVISQSIPKTIAFKFNKGSSFSSSVGNGSSCWTVGVVVKDAPAVVFLGSVSPGERLICFLNFSNFSTSSIRRRFFSSSGMDSVDTIFSRLE